MSDNVNKMPELKVGMWVKLKDESLIGMVMPFGDSGELAISFPTGTWILLKNCQGEFQIIEVYKQRTINKTFSKTCDDISIWKLEEKSPKQLEIERLEDIITNAYESIIKLKMENV